MDIHYTHWDRVTHICVSKLTIFGRDNGLLPGGRQAIIWTNVGLLLIWPLGTKFGEILIEIHIFSFKKIHFMMTSSNGNIFRVTVPLCGEFTGPRVNSTHKGQWRGALVFPLIRAWINGWVNNREAGDLRRLCAHYDVIVMWIYRLRSIGRSVWASICQCMAIVGLDNGLPPGPRLNIKTVLSTYGDFYVKDKTAVRTSYL